MPNPLAITAAVVLLAALLTILFASRELKLIAVWGALWGPVLGLWLLVPPLVSTHHLEMRTLLEWVVVTGFVAVIGVVLGPVLTMVSGAPFAAALLARRTAPKQPLLLAALVALWCLPAAYLALSVGIEWTLFRTLSSVTLSGIAVGALCLAHLLLGILLLLWYRRETRRGSFWRGLAVRVVIALFAAGVMSLPLRVTAANPAIARSLPQLQRSASQQGKPKAPLLFIGIDAATWTVLRPAIDAGTAPTLARLVDEGIHGDIEALWPPYWSAPAWAAIATGHPPEVTGVHEDLIASAPGVARFEFPLRMNALINPLVGVERLLIDAGVIQVSLMPRSHIAVPPIWERLSSAGVRTAVVRLPFTHPASGQAAVVVSSLVATDLWDAAGVKPGERSGLGSPSDWNAEAAFEFARDLRSSEDTFGRVFPRKSWPQPRGADADPVMVLQRMCDVETRVLNLAERVITTEAPFDVVMVYLSSLDPVTHAFWPYRFPETFPQAPDAPDIAALGPVIDRYVSFLDEGIGRLIAAMPSRPNVVIASDHGQESNPHQPLWKGVHARLGAFLAAGPDVSRTTVPVRLSYFDVVPTILGLLGLATPGDVKGTSIVR